MVLLKFLNLSCSECLLNLKNCQGIVLLGFDKTILGISLKVSQVRLCIEREIEMVTVC